MSKIKRMPDNDDLLVCGLGKMLLVNWNGADFRVLSVIDNVHSGEFLS